MTNFDNIVKQLEIDVLPTRDQLKDEYVQVSRSFISDTNTAPTPEGFQYAINASVGDDYYFDYSTSTLESHFAKITGKEGCLFICSGTQANAVAVRTHLEKPPYSVLCDARGHIYKMEGGGMSLFAQANVVPVLPRNGHHLTLEDVKANAILGENILTTPTRVISLENTLNGLIFPQDELVKIATWARQQDPPIIVHCDGARIWHVLADSKNTKTLAELCEPFDTVCLDLSKALGGAMGSMLCGNAAFIKHAKWIRKTFGGGLRQIGSLAALGAYALTYNFKKLPEVRRLTVKLEQGLRQLGIGILVPVETNMVFYDPEPIGLTIEQITEAAESGKYCERLWLDSSYSSRLVVHHQTSEKAIDDLLFVIHKLKEENPLPRGYSAAPKELTPAETYHLIYNRRPGIGFS